MMNIGISTWLYAKIPVEEAMRRVRDAGFHVVELWADLTQLDPRVFPEAGLYKVKEFAQSLNLSLLSFHAPFTKLDLACLDKDGRALSLGLTLKSLEYCFKLGCRHFIIHPGSKESMEAEEGKSIILDSVREVCLKARRLNIYVLLENMLEYGPRRYGSKVKDLLEIIGEMEGLNLDNVGICLDTGHVNFNKLNLHYEVREAGKNLLALHVNDNDGFKDSHLTPGEGSIDWSLFLKSLIEVKYKGAFMLEVYGGEKPDDVINKCKPEKLLRLIG